MLQSNAFVAFGFVFVCLHDFLIPFCVWLLLLLLLRKAKKSKINLI